MKPETMEDLVKIYALQDAIYQQTGIRNSITFTPYITLGYIVGPVGNMQFYQDLLDKLQKRVKQAVQTQGKEDIFEVSRIMLSYFSGMNNFGRIADFSWQRQEPFKKDAVRTALRRQQQKQRALLESQNRLLSQSNNINHAGPSFTEVDQNSNIENEVNDIAGNIGNADQLVYRGLSLGYGNLINEVALQKTEGALVIGAHTIFENAGSLTALRQAYNAVNALHIAVWGRNSHDLETLRALGIDKIATLYTGLGEALMAMEKYKISPKKVVLINSDLDLDNIKTEYGLADASIFFQKNRELQAVHVFTPKTGDANKQINAIPLAIAKAVAIIFDEENVRAQFARMITAFMERGIISEADAKSLNQLTVQISDIPLVTVSDDIAWQQVTYEDTLNKI